MWVCLWLAYSLELCFWFMKCSLGTRTFSALSSAIHTPSQIHTKFKGLKHDTFRFTRTNLEWQENRNKIYLVGKNPHCHSGTCAGTHIVDRQVIVSTTASTCCASDTKFSCDIRLMTVLSSSSDDASSLPTQHTLCQVKNCTSILVGDLPDGLHVLQDIIIFFLSCLHWYSTFFASNV